MSSIHLDDKILNDIVTDNVFSLFSFNFAEEEEKEQEQLCSIDRFF
jgi:hypothetical protein